MTQPDIEIVTDEAGFAALREDWNDLSARDPDHRIWQTFDIAWRAWELAARPRGRKLWILVVRDHGRAVLIWPLIRQRRHLWRQLRWLGVEGTEYCDVLVERGPDEDRWLKIAIDEITKTGATDLLFLPWLRDDSMLRRVISNDRAGLVRTLPAPYVAVGDWTNWEAFFAGRSRNFRSELRRRFRRLAEQGEVSFRLAADEAETRTAVAWLLAQKRAWMDRTSKDNQWLKTPQYAAFMHALAQDGLANGSLRLMQLRVDGQIIGAVLCLVRGPVLEYVIDTYDPSWERFSPGSQIRLKIIELAFEEGLATVDLRIGDSHQKQRVSDGAVQTQGRFVPCSRWGHFFVHRFHGKFSNLYTVLPKGLQLKLRGS